MVTVCLALSQGSYEVLAEGHALFDRKGQDIVCASVSVIIQGWVLSSRLIGRVEPEVLEKKAGFFRAKVPSDGGDVRALEILWQSLVLNLRSLSREYEDNLKVTLEETNGGK